ncbi:sulfotransferase [Thermodesulfobacteriota bacterium]
MIEVPFLNFDLKGKNLIFLISQPRAGSTMLQRILASHPLVLSSAEPWLMLHPVYGTIKTGVQADYNAPWAHDALQDFLANYTDGEETYFEAVRAFACVLYGRALQGTDKKYFLDKTPRYYFIIPQLYRLFPDARFIFLIRNPLSVLNSIINSWITNDHWHHLSDFRHDLLHAPALLLEGINILGSKAHIIRYENIVEKPERTISSLCQSLEISYQPGMLNYGKKEAPKGRYGDIAGVNRHNEPSRDSLNSWIHLTEKQQTRHFALAYLETLGSELVEQLGYSYPDLINTIGKSISNKRSPIVPWGIAIRPSSSWTEKEYLTVKRAMAFQKKGTARGILSFIRENHRTIIRSLLPL